MIFLGLVVAAGCNTNSNEHDIVSLSDTTSVSGLTGDSVKLVKKANIECKVKDAHQSARAVSQLAQSAGALITHQSISANEEGRQELKLSNDSVMVVSSFYTRADITVRVPVENLENFLYSVADLATFVPNSAMDIDDRSLSYLALQLKQKNHEQVLSTVHTVKPKDAYDFIDEKDETIDQQIARRQIDADARYSTVQLNLVQNPIVRKEVIANTDLSNYRLPFGKSMGQALYNGWTYFLDVLVVLANLWPFILIALAVWLGIRMYRRRAVLATK